jgi:RHS repeat-associated protein
MEGELAWRTRSTLWGTTAVARGATADTPLRHPGQYADPETGLHYNLNRHYDPATARYMSADPLGLGPAPNPVAWVQNPLVWADPLGLVKCEPADGMTNRERPPVDGDTNYIVDDPNDWSKTITDIDRVEGDTLWEEKQATGQDPRINTERWVEKHVFKKLDSYVEARSHLEGWQNAKLGMDFTTPGATPEFKAAVEQAIGQWKVNNPGVEVRVRWAQ